jgi:hypothetical protein
VDDVVAGLGWGLGGEEHCSLDDDIAIGNEEALFFLKKQYSKRDSMANAGCVVYIIN